MFNRERRNLGTPVLVLDPVGVRARVHVMGAGMVEVRLDVMLKEIRLRWSLQRVPKKVHRSAIQMPAFLDHREHLAA